MGSFYCQCLNVTVRYIGEVDNFKVVKAEELNTIVPKHLKEKTLTPVNLDIGGVTSELPSLVQVYIVGDWHIYHCTNCSTDVYCIKTIKPSEVLVFDNLLKTPVKLKVSPDYSPIFNITLRPSFDQNMDGLEGTHTKRTSSMNFGSLEDPVLVLLQNRMKTYLSKEEQNMEQRIREYETQQREEFKKLQEQAYEDRRRIFEAVYRARESGITDAMLDLAVNSETKDMPAFEDTDSNIKLSKLLTNISAKESTRHKEPSRKHSLERTSIKSIQTVDTIDEENVFDFDEELGGVNVTPMAQFPSSSEDDDYDSSSTEGNSFQDRAKLLLPASLPMSMPVFANKESSDIVKSPTDPNEVAKSIQQLALSVHDTGMFGDLPKPRVNSKR